MRRSLQEKIEQVLARDENRWIKGLAPQEAEALKKAYKERYNQ